MSIRWRVAAVAAAGAAVAVVAGVSLPGRAEAQYGGGGPRGGKSSAFWQQAQAAQRVESASKLQTSQAEARRAAALNRGEAKAAARADTPLDDATALAAVINANGKKVPASGEELRHALSRLGDFAQLPVPFSAVALDSGLSNPRVLIAARGRPLDPAPAFRPALAGRLFLAANMEKSAAGDARVRSVEFISWNARRGKFDFGVIEDLGGTPHVRVVDGVRCFSCHKNRGPILGAGPWSNTTHNDVVRSATELTFLPVPGVPREAPPEWFTDGMTLFAARAADVDAGVRSGATLAANRAGFRLLSRDPQGRKALVEFLAGAVAPGGLEKIDHETSVVANRLVEQQFLSLAGDWASFRKAERPSVLNDFSPAGSVGTTGGAWSGSAEAVGRYDVGRIRGEHKLAAQAHPSSPSAFVRPVVKVPAYASQVVSSASLARTIGLSEGDRAFLGKSLADAAKGLRQPKVTAMALAREVFGGPQFRDALEGGVLPDREDFKDRFVRGLDEVLRAHGVAAGFAPSRDEYVSGPVFVAGKDEPEPRVEPTTACLRCHEVRGEGRAKFAEPLPALAFDPFDKAAREAWVKGANRQRKQDVLGRMLQRVGVNKDMPPEDEPEYEHFRVNGPAAFDEVKQFLEAALKEAKGK